MSSADATVTDKILLNVLKKDILERESYWGEQVESLQAKELDLANQVAELQDVNSQDKKQLQEERETNKSIQQRQELRLENQAREIAKHSSTLKDLKTEFEIMMRKSKSQHQEQVNTIKSELASRSTQHVTFLQAASKDIAELESKLTYQGLEHQKALQEMNDSTSKSKEHAFKRVRDLEILVASMAATTALPGKDKCQQRTHERTEISTSVSHERLVSNVIDCINFL
jgi:hypothetical protein